MSSNLNITREEKLILLCARTSIEDEIRLQIEELIENRVNWQQFFYRSSSHGLLPLIYYNLQNFKEQIPVNLLLLKDYFIYNSQKNLLFYGKLLELLELFKENQITAIPYKGPITAINSYNNLALREFGDIDFFIESKDIELLKKILKNEGYEETLNLDPSKEKYYLKYQRELKFKKHELFIELHWNVAGVSFTLSNKKQFPINKDYKSIKINDREINIFTDEDMLLIHALHAAGHLWSRLSWICDISELIENSDDLNWEYVIDKARYLSIERILYLNLSLTNKLFDTELPEHIQENIKNDPVIRTLETQVIDLIFNAENFNFQKKIILRYKIRENSKDGLKDIFKIISIPQSYEWSSFRQKGPIGLLYILKRPGQIIKRLRE